MNLRKASLLAAIAAGFDSAVDFTRGYTLDEATRAKHRRQAGYPQTGTGKRQGERVARQVARSLGNPFAASDACIERIKARLAAKPNP
jgi:hypothetical protein